ncbi:MAG: hypothetical protein QOI95_3594 [Acidimicrobiaceae bacterium]|jgi:hypothetical protein
MSRRHLPGSPRSRAIVAVVVIVAIVAFAALRSDDGKKSAASTSSSAAPAVSLPGQTPIDVKFWNTISGIDPLATQVPGRANATGLAMTVCAAINPSMTVAEAQAAATAVLSQALVRAVAIPYWAGAASAAYCPQFSPLLTGTNPP